MGIFVRKTLKDPRTPEEIRAYVDHMTAEKERVCNSDYKELSPYEQTIVYRKHFTRMDKEIFRAALMAKELQKEYVKLDIEYKCEVYICYINPSELMTCCGDEIDVLSCDSVHNPHNKRLIKERSQDWLEAKAYAIETLGFDRSDLSAINAYANEHLRTPVSEILKITDADGTVFYDRGTFLKQDEGEKKNREGGEDAWEKEN